MMFSAADHAHMAEALRLAALGLNTTTPNPRVGCVLVRDGVMVGHGWHRRAGAPHAEVEALRMAGEAARGATAYVSLEPCNHHGRTPPCSEALIAAGITRVVAAMQDPNPLVAGKGLARLKASGLEVGCGLLEDSAEELNIGFVQRMRHGRPWLRLKAAASLDGRTALDNGVSQWITSEPARRDGHRWRARACAILSGIGTVLTDDPQLNVRLIDSERQPLRVLVDSHLRLPLDARLLDGQPLLLVHADDPGPRGSALRARGVELLQLPDTDGRVNLVELLRQLGGRGINEVHVEAGRQLNGALWHSGCVDELLLYLAPMLLGQGRGILDLPTFDTLGPAPRLHIREWAAVGQDLRVLARPARQDGR